MENKLDKGQDLQSLWTQMAQEKFGNQKLQKQNIMEALKKESALDIDKLKKGLGIKILWCCAFLVGFIIMKIMMIVNKDNTEFLKVMAVATLLYLIAAGMLYLEYRKMGSTLGLDDNVLELMKHNLETI